MMNQNVLLNSVKMERAFPALPRNCIFASIGALTMVISLGFAAMGAWPVLPYAGIECIALFCAWRWLKSHEDDREVIVMTGNLIKVHQRVGPNFLTKSFNLEWLQVVVENKAKLRRSRVVLRCYGEDLEIGRLLSDNERIRLAGSIRRLISKNNK